MARRLRIDIPNGLYHVTSRGPQRRALACERRAPEHGLELLDRERRLLCHMRRGRRAIEQMSNVKEARQNAFVRRRPLGTVFSVAWLQGA